MPRPGRAFGRPNTRVIPQAWAAAHVPVIEENTGVLSVTIAWRRPGGVEGAFDPSSLSKTVTPLEAHHTGPADLQLLPQLMQERVIAEDDLAVSHGYRVTVEHDAGTDGTDFEVGDVGTVIEVDDNADQSLLGKKLRVRAIERPSHGWQRYLLCSETLGG